MTVPRITEGYAHELHAAEIGAFHGQLGDGVRVEVDATHGRRICHVRGLLTKASKPIETGVAAED